MPPILYAALAARDSSPGGSWSLRQIGSHLQGHPDMRKTGVDMTSGSLGQGFAAGLGMALAGKLNGQDQVYCLLGTAN